MNNPTFSYKLQVDFADQPTPVDVWALLPHELLHAVSVCNPDKEPGVKQKVFYRNTISMRKTCMV